MDNQTLIGIILGIIFGLIIFGPKYLIESNEKKQKEKKEKEEKEAEIRKKEAKLNNEKQLEIKLNFFKGLNKDQIYEKTKEYLRNNNSSVSDKYISTFNNLKNNIVFNHPSIKLDDFEKFIIKVKEFNDIDYPNEIENVIFYKSFHMPERSSLPSDFICIYVKDNILMLKTFNIDNPLLNYGVHFSPLTPNDKNTIGDFPYFHEHFFLMTQFNIYSRMDSIFEFLTKGEKVLSNFRFRKFDNLEAEFAVRSGSVPLFNMNLDNEFIDFYLVNRIVPTLSMLSYVEDFMKPAFEREIKNYSNKLDKSIDGSLNISENDFRKMISQYQDKISENDKKFLHNFTKMSSYLDQKRKIILQYFDSLLIVNPKEAINKVNFIEEQHQHYNILLFHSINMFGALLKQDYITFYEIYEQFDKLGIYNSSWENEISNKLNDINSSVSELIESVNKLESNLVHSIDNLSYVMESGYENLNQTVKYQLSSINASVNMNNLLTGIQIYQSHKLNRKLK